MRGSRIQAVVRELNNEKIDIVNFSEQPEILITRALSPAKPVNLYIDEEKEYCIAIFEDENLDSAIGRSGMNINLASRVTGYKIDAYGINQYKRLQDDQNTLLSDIDGIEGSLTKILNDSNIKTVTDLMDADEESLSEVKGLSSEKVETIFSLVQSFIEREIDEPDDESSVDLSVSEEE
jgi:N utilization substance protein A